MAQASPHPRFEAVVLTGDRGPGDPLVQGSGVCCKALVEVAGTPMVLRVLEALEGASSIGGRHLCGPRREQLPAGSALQGLIDSGRVAWCEPLASPSASAFQAMRAVPSDRPVLVTTADHALLSPTIVDYFCTRSAALGADVAVGLARYDLVREAFPGLRKTVLRFSDERYCGCNLFAFLTPRGRRVAAYWRRVEAQRKRPLRLVRILGWRAVLRYLSGRLSLEEALRLLSRGMRLDIRAVPMPYAEAAVDVDSLADRAVVEERLSRPDRDGGQA